MCHIICAIISPQKESIKEEIIMDYVIDGKIYLKLNDFAELIGKKPNTILRRKDEIPVIKKVGKEWYALNGTRYPCKVNSFKIKDNWDKRYVLLKAIGTHRYIDNTMLCIYTNEFEMMLSDFVNAGLIEENHNSNNYGANGFSCTFKGSVYLRKQKSLAIKAIIEDIAKVAGIFTGAVLSQILQ